ncbi:cell division protein ZapA [Amphritea sp. 1_MG-2023]|uniref:cell division protein ZapA n=1 Tax=Amphritea sp. 1_MG-2023 TaxID=3062670 RepID=UPI0026E15337|nr:cell division protein ZapA [Amphritea sp. 1_MG-2023]MDO6565182.1 cell division protein ZapA [Amphritea sp. 1_MG-2023]
MSNARNISVTLLGKEYVVACPPEAETELLQAAASLDQKMQSIRAGGRIIGSEKVAVMAALNLTYELQANQASEREEVSSRLNQLTQLLDKTLTK